MHQRPRLFTADPPRIAARGGNFTVKSRCQFKRDKRPPFGDELSECLDELRGFFLAQSPTYFYAGAAQLLKSFTSNQRIGVFYARDDFMDACGDQRASARRRATVMAARFEGDVESRTPGLGAGLSKSIDFRVRTPGLVMIAGADDFVATHDHRAHRRIGARSPHSFARQTTGHAEVVNLLPRSLVPGQRYSLLGRVSPGLKCGTVLRSLMSSSSSTMNSPMSLNERYTEANRT